LCEVLDPERERADISDRVVMSVAWVSVLVRESVRDRSDRSASI
jgi:hypothetical protein